MVMSLVFGLMMKMVAVKQRLTTMTRRWTASQSRGERGQSMVEMALAFPILLLVLAGALEVGKYFNDYLTLLDSTREAARWEADHDYSSVVEPPYAVDANDPKNYAAHGKCDGDFYRQAACLVFQNIYGFRYDPAVDDVVVSVVSIGSDGKVAYRFPRPCSGGGPMPPAGMYQGCNSLVTSRAQGWSYCQNVIQQNINREEMADPKINYTGTACQPKASLYSDHDIETLLNTTSTPRTGLVLVEVYHVHRQFLGLIPPTLPFLPQQVMMHAYTIMPNPSAAPISP